MLAGMAMRLEAARQLTCHAAELSERAMPGEDTARLTFASAAANCSASAAAMAITTDAVRQASGVPVRKTAGLDDENWRGLQLIDSLTGSQWGWAPATAGPGKCVWAAVNAAGAAGMDL